LKRRDFLRKFLLGGLTLATAKQVSWDNADAVIPTIPTRPLGRTGHKIPLFSLGGEGILRTTGRLPEARAVIERAIELGVGYCDTAPAYQQSQDYYGATLGARRENIFLAAKTHERSKVGSLALLEDSLRRLNTDRLDLWQLHDLRTRGDLARIFGPGGAIEAVEEARRQGKIRFVGITGHHDPGILLEAMELYSFDTVLLPVNVADKKRLSFIERVVPVANQKGMGVIGMKVMGQGELFDGLVSAQEAMRQQISTIIVGCSSPTEVASNADYARSFTPMSDAEMKAMEDRVLPHADGLNLFKTFS
jgi:predicted aldo/keto reductase-like oxidoreductase